VKAAHNPNPTPLNTEPRARWGRPLALVAAVLFFISWVFPAGAGFSKNATAFPKWWGVLDVGLAFVLAILALWISVLTQGKVTRQAEDASYRTYRILTHGILVWTLVFILFGDRITWINCATGFAWRTWLALYMLPAWFTLRGAPAGLSGSEGGPDQVG
jgi:hypothetical protein